MSKITDAIASTPASIKSLAKLVLQSRRASITRQHPEGNQRLIVMGNGPSLNDTIAAHLPLLRQSVTMAVNFAANAPVFTEIRPRYYILVDPHFFSDADDANLNRLFASLSAVDWTMTLIVPVEFAKKVPRTIIDNTYINIATVNAIGIEGWQWLRNLAYDRGLGMPRPRNVLIPAIMAGAAMGYKEIYVVGADHSWMSTISVNERNEVVSIQPHFYKEDEREVKRINTAYLKYPLHQIVHSFYLAFKAYHDIQAYARSRGIAIYNSTPGSFIDAFPRKEL